MKILWVKNDFLHPTDRGGQIRTLETLRRLHRRHEVHYAGFEDPAQPEGLRRAPEYSSFAYPVQHRIPKLKSPEFFPQFVKSFISPLPLAVGRYHSPAMKRLIEDLERRHSFDAIVCDFLSSAPNIPNLGKALLFQHNVETVIWRRHAEHAADPVRRRYFAQQARKMFETERDACRRASHVIAVSRQDAETMRDLFGVTRVSEVTTGVDVDYFHRPASPARKADLVFVGGMHWLPNVDGVLYFVNEILPIVRRRKPDCRVAIAGRTPTAEILALAQRDPLIEVTGTLPDVRPYLWGSAVSVVPLRIGGGTRLKIYEAMAAGIPVISTAVGAEGLAYSDGVNIRIADSAAHFAASCLELLENQALRSELSRNASKLVASQCSWDTVSSQFEEILQSSASDAGKSLQASTR